MPRKRWRSCHGGNLGRGAGSTWIILCGRLLRERFSVDGCYVGILRRKALRFSALRWQAARIRRSEKRSAFRQTHLVLHPDKHLTGFKQCTALHVGRKSAAPSDKYIGTATRN